MENLYKLHDQILTVSHRAAYNLCNNFDTDHLQDHMEDHEFVHEDHHDDILKAFKEVCFMNPQMASYVKDEIVSICNSVMRKQDLSEHHEHAESLHNKIQEVHDEILNSLKGERKLLDHEDRIGECYESAIIRDSVLYKLQADNKMVIDKLKLNSLQNYLKFEERDASNDNRYQWDAQDAIINSKTDVQEMEKLLDEYVHRAPNPFAQKSVAK